MHWNTSFLSIKHYMQQNLLFIQPKSNYISRAMGKHLHIFIGPTGQRIDQTMRNGGQDLYSKVTEYKAGFVMGIFVLF